MHTSKRHEVHARNLSQASENKIHDDDIAQRFGFKGGLVPGVEVYAYMTHLPVARWGIEWLERGTAQCRFAKPVYDGARVTVTATEAGSALSIAVESQGEHCASGSAALPEKNADAPVTWNAAPTPASDARPDANEKTLAPGRRLSSHPLHIDDALLDEYLAAIQETDALYSREKIVHPALMLRLCNSALKDNVKLGPWIHTGSVIRHCGLARAGESLAAHGEVAANYERKGHRFVDLDVVIVTNETRPIAVIGHTAIYRLRQ